MARKKVSAVNCGMIWILKEGEHFADREGRKGIPDRRNSLCKGKEGKKALIGFERVRE